MYSPIIQTQQMWEGFHLWPVHFNYWTLDEYLLQFNESVLEVGVVFMVRVSLCKGGLVLVTLLPPPPSCKDC